MSRVIDALIAYRVLKLLVTPFNRTKAFELGIIDDKGKVLKKSKEIKNPKERNAYTLLIRFVFNLKKLLAKVGIRGPIGSAAAAADPIGPRIPTFANNFLRLNTKRMRSV